MRQRKSFNLPERKQLCLQKKCVTTQASSNHPENSSVRHPSWTNNPKPCKKVARKEGTVVPRVAWLLGHWCRTVGGRETAHSKIPSGNTTYWTHCYQKKKLTLNSSTFAHTRYTFRPSGVQTPKEKSIWPNLFSLVEKHRRTQTALRPRLRNIIKSCRTDGTTNAGISYWPESGNKANLSTVKHLYPSPLLHSRYLQFFGKFLWIRSQFFIEFLFPRKEIFNWSLYSQIWCCSAIQENNGQPR